MNFYIYFFRIHNLIKQLYLLIGIQSLYSKFKVSTLNQWHKTSYEIPLCAQYPKNSEQEIFSRNFFLRVSFFFSFFKKIPQPKLLLIKSDNYEKKTQKKKTFLEKSYLSLIDSNKTRTHNHLVRKRTNDWAVLWILICTMHLTVCYYHVTYEFPSESTLCSFPECQQKPLLEADAISEV